MAEPPEEIIEHERARQCAAAPQRQAQADRRSEQVRQENRDRNRRFRERQSPSDEVVNLEKP